ncbi:hypothetical protein [uncultured Azohydromonas sp.]|jgi:hypothetical protein|uniref:hypothetical protein n=1 Tax=uncultured Azohydromonas sp. TaxID=487342 RepID=UPI002612CE61|nr:hypothetical protein [uncultured Azohydromonas sp.]
MRKFRYTDVQAAVRLCLKAGMPAAQGWRHNDLTDATLEAQAMSHADLDATGTQRLRVLEQENARLRRLVADLILDRRLLQEVVRNKP